MLRKAAGYLGAVLILAMFGAGVVAYYVTSVDPVSYIPHDGFGRPLSESPRWVSAFLEPDRKWAGWNWFLIDIVIFWSGVGVGSALIYFGFKRS